MKLRSVNVGMPGEVTDGGRKVWSGIYKTPVEGAVMARRLNLEGDGQADLIAHGGEQRAVYVYPWENYAHWERELERDDFSLGQFGENFTTEGLTEDSVHIGDVFRIGNARFEVTQPRPPCSKLAMRMGERGFIKRFLSSGLVGFYLRVLEEGEVSAGDVIERISTGPEEMTVTAISKLLFFDKGNIEDAARALRIPALSPGWQDSFRERLALKKESG